MTPGMIARSALGALGFFLTVTIVAIAAEEAITATTRMDRFEALGDVFFWLGLFFTTAGLGATGAVWRKGSGGSGGGGLSLAIGTILYGLASIAFSLAVRAGG
jgi:hypothetical protein